ncbi:MAG: sel1 repeat family protein [Synergistaceae bacterium]|nr:sel1 repeat family protein [Synergistaceae bacterium]
MTMMLFEMGGEPGERGYFRACFLGLSVFFVLTFLIAVPGAASEMPGTQEQAFAAIQEEADRGDPQALLTLGGFYAEGVGVQKNYSKARECYEKAAQAGMAEGIYNVGVCWEVGMGSEADPKQAVEFFRRAADMNLPQAMFKMSFILDVGSGVERDEKASIDYMSKAAAAGHPDAASIMGLVYLNGLRGYKKDAGEGLRMLKVAASSGNVEAMKNIAVVYKDGMGTLSSPPEALKWYVIAEKCGYPAEALSAVTAELRKKLSGDEQKKAETEADAWISAARAAVSAGR